VRPRSVAAVIAIAAGALICACGSAPPSVSPSGSRGVEGVQDARIVEFTGHVIAANAIQARLIPVLAKASAGTPAELAAAARHMADWADGEIAWLDAHPSLACYQVAADAYRDGVTMIKTAAAAFVALAAAPSPRSDTQGQAAAQGLSDGGSAIQGASLQASALRDACSA
jgi:hypothetical protein